MKKGMGISILSMVFLIGLLVSGAFSVMMGAPAWEENTNRPGMDYKQMDVQTIEQCQNACKADQQCKSFTLVKPMNLQSSTSGKCMLKNGVPTPQTDKCCTSGLKTSAQASNPFQNQENQSQMPPASSVTLPPEKKVPNISTVDGSVRDCPPQIIVDNITIQPKNISSIPPGYSAIPTNNLPIPFKFLRAGQESNTFCFCEYELGRTGYGPTGMVARLKLDLAGTGYSTCSAQMGFSGKPDTIKLYK
jgi:hypothetical protein